MSETDAKDMAGSIDRKGKAASGEFNHPHIPEFISRLKYICDSYEFFSKSFGSCATFNDSLDILSVRLGEGCSGDNLTEGLDHCVATTVGHKAKELAVAEGSEVQPKHKIEAARVLSQRARKIQGRPKDKVLEFHVEGLIALIHEFSGKTVKARRDKNSVYEPHFAGDASKVVPLIVKPWGASISTTQLVNLVRKIQKRHGERPPAFASLFPGYNLTLTPIESTTA